MLSSLNLFGVHTPDYTLTNLNRDRRLQVWPLRQIGNLYSKGITYSQNYLKYANIIFFQMVVTQGHHTHLAELWLSWQEFMGFNGRPGLNNDCDPTRVPLPASCPFEVCLWCGNQGQMNDLESVLSSSSWESEITGWSAQTRKHLHPRILNFSYF